MAIGKMGKSNFESKPEGCAENRIVNGTANNTAVNGMANNTGSRKTKKPTEWEQARTLAPDRLQRERALGAIGREIAGKRIRHAPACWELVWIEFQFLSEVSYSGQKERAPFYKR